MAERDSNTVVLNRPTVLLVTGVGVGLLTLTYVLGVQVGKQSAAMKVVRSVASGEDLLELPASLDEQLKQIEEMEKARRELHTKPHRKHDAHKGDAPAAENHKVDAPKVDALKADTKVPDAKSEKPEAKIESKAESKPESKTEAKPAPKNDGKWTVQLISTTSEKEAKQLSEKARGAGFPTTVVKEGAKYKVRLAKTGPKPDMDIFMTKLKAKKMDAFPIKVE